MTQLDPLLPEAEVDAEDRPAIDWPTDPWDNSDRTGTVERLRRQTRPVKWTVYTLLCLAIVAADEKGEIEVEVSAGGLKPATVTLTAE